MVEQAAREPTMDEIVVALREARRGASGTPSLTVVGGQDGANQTADTLLRRNDSAPAHADEHDVRTRIPIDAAALRNQEMERLLTENARLTQRVMFLINIIEQQQPHTATPTPADDTIEAARSAMAREVRSALEAELRPLLLAVLRLLEKRQASAVAPVGEKAAPPGAPRAAPGIRPIKRKAESPATPAVPSEWLLELIGKLDCQDDEPAQQQAAPDPRTPEPRPAPRRKFARLFRSVHS